MRVATFTQAHRGINSQVVSFRYARKSLTVQWLWLHVYRWAADIIAVRNVSYGKRARPGRLCHPLRCVRTGHRGGRAAKTRPESTPASTGRASVGDPDCAGWTHRSSSGAEIEAVGRRHVRR